MIVKTAETRQAEKIVVTAGVQGRLSQLGFEG